MDVSLAADMLQVVIYDQAMVFDCANTALPFFTAQC